MGIGYLPPVLAPRFIFVSRPVSLYTVIERVKSRFRNSGAEVSRGQCRNVLGPKCPYTIGLLFEQQGLKLTQIDHEIIESLINGTDRPAANRRTH